MNKVAWIFTISFFISGCTVNNKPISTITPHPLIKNATPTSSTTITATAETPTQTPLAKPSATPSPLFFDDFNLALQPGWEWVNEDKRYWSLDSTPGSLQLNVIGGYVKYDNIRNMLLRAAPEGDFQAETHLVFFPNGKDQFAGLILFESNKNFIQAGYSYCKQLFSCDGRGLYLDIYKNGELQLPRNASKFQNDNIFLRIVRKGETIYFIVSEDRKIWFQTNSYTTNMGISKIGIVTGQNLVEEPASAIFDYFLVTRP